MLVIIRPGTEENFVPLYNKLIDTGNIKMYLEKNAKEKIAVLQNSDQNLKNINMNILETFEKSIHEKIIDIVIVIGGDGTILRAVANFQNKETPPIIGFAKGHLSFLANYNIEKIPESIDSIMTFIKSEKKCSIEKRMRIVGQWTSKKTNKMTSFHCLNDIVIHRGCNPDTIKLSLFLNDNELTFTYCDGIILSTTTGSTAYALSCGGPLIHHGIRCYLLVPICPHSLSFRPLVLPNEAILRIKLISNSGKPALLSGDGIFNYEMEEEDELVILPTENDAKFFLQNKDSCFEY